jgi:hypothetical protein
MVMLASAAHILGAVEADLERIARSEGGGDLVKGRPAHSPERGPKQEVRERPEGRYRRGCNVPQSEQKEGQGGGHENELLLAALQRTNVSITLCRHLLLLHVPVCHWETWCSACGSP